MVNCFDNLPNFRIAFLHCFGKNNLSHHYMKKECMQHEKNKSCISENQKDLYIYISFHNMSWLLILDFLFFSFFSSNFKHTSITKTHREKECKDNKPDKRGLIKRTAELGYFLSTSIVMNACFTKYFCTWWIAFREVLWHICHNFISFPMAPESNSYI